MQESHVLRDVGVFALKLIVMGGVAMYVGSLLPKIEWVRIRVEALSQSMGLVYFMDVLMIGLCAFILFIWLWVGRPGVIDEMERSRAKAAAASIATD